MKTIQSESKPKEVIAKILGEKANAGGGFWCPKCGNGDRFIEEFEAASDIVDRFGNQIELNERTVGHYQCATCQQNFPYRKFWEGASK